MHPHATFFAKTFTAIALLLSFGLVGQTCSTQSPTVVLDPDNIGGDDDDNGDGGGGTPLPDQEPSAPEHGALILDGRPLILDAQPNAKIVDCHSVISIYYSESMKTKTITSSSFVLSEKLFGSSVTTSQSTWLMGNRLLIIEPQQPLLPSTTYQLTAVEGPVDLDGLAYDPGTSPVIIEFTTAATVDGIPPEILASYPLNSSANQPNDSQAVVVFSKEIDTASISPAVGFSNQTTSLPGDYDTTPGLDTSGNRVFSFDHRNDASDLDATIKLDVSTLIFDKSFDSLFMVSPYTSIWQNMNLQRPQAIQFDLAFFGDFAPAANSINHRAFPLEVLMPPFALPADEVKLRVHQFDANHNDDSRVVEGESVVGGGLASFTLDLNEDVLGVSTPIFEYESEMLIGAYTERNGVRSTVSLRRDADGEFEPIAHDLIPPVVSQFGPAYGSNNAKFHCTLPIVRPYGVASEAIGEVTVNGDSRIVPLVSDDAFFIGKSFDPGAVTITGAEVPFELDLTDAAGNPSDATVSASARFSGFVGGTDLATSAGTMRVVAIDKQDLFPIDVATIHIEDFPGGGNEDVLTSGSDGAVTFLGRVGKQTVTIQRPEWQATTIIGINASLISLPLTAASSLPIPLSPQILNITGGVSKISSNTLAVGEFDSGPDESMVQDYDLDTLFASVDSQPNQPGWFVSFHDVEEYRNVGLPFFRFVGLEKHVIVAPSTSASGVVPVIEMAQSSNDILGDGNEVNIYEIDVGSLSNFSSTSLSTVIPGLRGPVVVGIGDVNDAGDAAAAELEINLLNQAQQEGASPDGWFRANAYGTGGGNQLSGTVVVEGLGASSVTIAEPAMPVVVVGTGDTYPFSVEFTDTLSKGMYEMTIFEGPIPAGEGVWNVIVMAGSSLSGDIPLPTLPVVIGGTTASIPLSTSAGTTWNSSVAAYEMSEFPASERGFFFDAVKRDRISWAKSASKAVVSF